jgi:hypothetical protein
MLEEVIGAPKESKLCNIYVIKIYISYIYVMKLNLYVKFNF